MATKRLVSRQLNWLPLAGLIGLCSLCPGWSLAQDDLVIEKDIVYGKGGDVELKLDLSMPKDGDGPFPALVLIHGGGWMGGTRQSFQPLAEQAARRGYVAVTVTYRLTQPDPETKAGKHQFPKQLHDCKCAVRWLRASAKKYHVDPDRIGVMGGSAGGHLSLLVGMVDEKAKLEGDGGHDDQSSRVQAVVNLFGPTDLTKAYDDVPQVRDLLIAFLGGTPAEQPDNYQAASPVTYVSEDDPPILTLHGDQDRIVLVSQATLLDEAMKAANADHEILILKDQGHGFSGEALTKAQEAMWSFLDRHVKSKPKDSK